MLFEILQTLNLSTRQRWQDWLPLEGNNKQCGASRVTVISMHSSNTSAENLGWFKCYCVLQSRYFHALQRYLEKSASEGSYKLHVLHFQAPEIKHLHSLLQIVTACKQIIDSSTGIPTNHRCNFLFPSVQCIASQSYCVYLMDWEREKKTPNHPVHSVSTWHIDAVMLLLCSVDESHFVVELWGFQFC